MADWKVEMKAELLGWPKAERKVASMAEKLERW
jgi:hypothetical protein